MPFQRRICLHNCLETHFWGIFSVPPPLPLPSSPSKPRPSGFSIMKAFAKLLFCLEFQMRFSLLLLLKRQLWQKIGVQGLVGMDELKHVCVCKRKKARKLTCVCLCNYAAVGADLCVFDCVWHFSFVWIQTLELCMCVGVFVHASSTQCFEPLL